MDAEVRDKLEAALVAHVTEAYAAWRVRGGREPSLTVGYLKNYLVQARVHVDFVCASSRQQYLMLRTVLGRLLRSGRLGSSLGVGDRGREARCYEPPPR